MLPGVSGESVLLDLERHGVICSSGSACAAGSDEPSHVLTAMGIPAETAQTALRFTFEADITDEALDQAADELVRRPSTGRLAGNPPPEVINEPAPTALAHRRRGPRRARPPPPQSPKPRWPGSLGSTRR